MRKWYRVIVSDVVLVEQVRAGERQEMGRVDLVMAAARTVGVTRTTHAVGALTVTRPALTTVCVRRAGHVVRRRRTRVDTVTGGRESIRATHLAQRAGRVTLGTLGGTVSATACRLVERQLLTSVQSIALLGAGL